MTSDQIDKLAEEIANAADNLRNSYDEITWRMVYCSAFNILTDKFAPVSEVAPDSQCICQIGSPYINKKCKAAEHRD